jgi:hypothetical protein
VAPCLSSSFSQSSYFLPVLKRLNVKEIRGKTPRDVASEDGHAASSMWNGILWLLHTIRAPESNWLATRLMYVRRSALLYHSKSFNSSVGRVGQFRNPQKTK